MHGFQWDRCVEYRLVKGILLGCMGQVLQQGSGRDRSGGEGLLLVLTM